MANYIKSVTKVDIIYWANFFQIPTIFLIKISQANKLSGVAAVIQLYVRNKNHTLQILDLQSYQKRNQRLKMRMA